MSARVYKADMQLFSPCDMSVIRITNVPDLIWLLIVVIVNPGALVRLVNIMASKIKGERR